jgi:hypothetical protein
MRSETVRASELPNADLSKTFSAKAIETFCYLLTLLPQYTVTVVVATAAPLPPHDPSKSSPQKKLKRLLPAHPPLSSHSGCKLCYSGYGHPA